MGRAASSPPGSTRVAPNGYHYTKTADRGWRLTHHIVAEEKLGRPLAENERVYFVDKDKTNFHPHNIEVRVTQNSKQDRIAFLQSKIAAMQEELDDLLRTS